MIRTLALFAALILAPLFGADSFTSVGTGAVYSLTRNPLGFPQTGTYQVSGSFVATVAVQFSMDGQNNWGTITAATAPVGPVVFSGAGYYRFSCSAYTSGTAVGTVVIAPRIYQQQYGSNGTLLFQVDDSGVTAAGLGTGAVSSVNGLGGAVVFAAGSGVTLTPAGQTITIASTGGGFANPMTTLGDVIYGAGGGTATRLAGNTTTTTQFYSSTGSGSAAAAPALAALNAGNIPNLPGTIITSGAVSPQFGGTGLNAATAANGSLLIGTGSGLALSTLTAGANVTITNASGGITIASSGSGGVSSFNTLTGAITLAAGTNVTLGTVGNTVTVNSTAGGTFAGNYTSVSDTAYTMLSTDAIVVESAMTAARIITLPAASAVPVGRLELVKDLSGSLTQTITITINRAGSDTIEGGTVGWTIRTPKGWRAFESDGVSNWHLVGMSKDIQFWVGAGSTTWTAEPGAKYGRVELIGAGAGGAGGAQEPSGTASVGGGGGSGGGYSVHDFLVADAGASATVVIGAGGTAGVGATSTGTAGGNSGAGGNTTFAAGTAGVQAIALGAALSVGGGAATGGTAGSAGQGVNAGGTAGAASTAGAGGNNASVAFGAGGGGGGPGGGISTAGTPFNNGGHGASGGCFGTFYGQVGASGNVRGSTDGGAGGTPSNITPSGYAVSGPGAGGGASSILTTGGAGGVGARPGGGGGGGGASLNTHNGGNGGAGGDGAAFVTQGL
jgi:hypothetical protein